MSSPALRTRRSSADRDLEEIERETNNNNTVKIRPGPFCRWDLLIGTFQPLPERVPPTGLHGGPDLHMNPLRLLVAGLAHPGAELWKNPPGV